MTRTVESDITPDGNSQQETLGKQKPSILTRTTGAAVQDPGRSSYMTNTSAGKLRHDAADAGSKHGAVETLGQEKNGNLSPEDTETELSPATASKGRKSSETRCISAPKEAADFCTLAEWAPSQH